MKNYIKSILVLLVLGIGIATQSCETELEAVPDVETHLFMYEDGSTAELTLTQISNYIEGNESYSQFREDLKNDVIVYSEGKIVQAGKSASCEARIKAGKSETVCGCNGCWTCGYSQVDIDVCMIICESDTGAVYWEFC